VTIPADSFLKALLVPLLIWGVSLVARRWGHTISGWISGLPLIGGPILVFLAIDLGTEFAARTAVATLTTVVACAAHCVAFAWIARRFGWSASLAGAWLTFALVAAVTAQFRPPATFAFLIACATMVVGVLALPRSARMTGPAPIPGYEIGLRMAAAVAMVLGITAGAEALGPTWSGVLLSIPIQGSVVPAFTRALHGHPATVQVLGGMLTGLIAFNTFFYAAALAVVPLGVTAGFASAVVATVGVTFAVGHARRAGWVRF
jgi:hypothetical protein